MTPQQLRDFLGRHELTVKTFAQVIGVTNIAVFNWLDEKRSISKTIARLCKTFDKYPGLLKEFGQ